MVSIACVSSQSELNPTRIDLRERADHRRQHCGQAAFSVIAAGFMRREAALGNVLNDHRLAAKNEEGVWEAVVRRMRGAVSRRVVGKVRFLLMEQKMSALHLSMMLGTLEGYFRGGAPWVSCGGDGGRRRWGRWRCTWVGSSAHHGSGRFGLWGLGRRCGRWRRTTVLLRRG